MRYLKIQLIGKIIFALIIGITIFGCNDEVVLRTSVNIEVLNNDGSKAEGVKFELRTLDSLEMSQPYKQDNGSNILSLENVELGEYELTAENENNTFIDTLDIYRAYIRTIYFND